MAGHHQEKLENHFQITLKGRKPFLEDNVFIAPGVKLIGDVRLKKYSSVWFNSVLRGDINFIEVGEFTNIQDLCLLHVTRELPVIVGNYVTVGHSVVLHACNIKDNVLIGMKAVILDNAEISENCLIAAGSVVIPKTKIPPGVLVGGVPAKIIRDLSENEIQQIRQSALNYLDYAKEIEESLTQRI